MDRIPEPKNGSRYPITRIWIRDPSGSYEILNPHLTFWREIQLDPRSKPTSDKRPTGIIDTLPAYFLSRDTFSLSALKLRLFGEHKDFAFRMHLGSAKMLSVLWMFTKHAFFRRRMWPKESQLTWRTPFIFLETNVLSKILASRTQNGIHDSKITDKFVRDCYCILGVLTFRQGFERLGGVCLVHLFWFDDHRQQK